MPTKTSSPNGKVKQALSTTTDGWPCGLHVELHGDWIVIMSPTAHAKLMAWDRVANGLELSGFGILTDRPHADPREDKIFYIDDMILICDIQESSGGYTEMTPEQRFRGMKWARDMGRSANQLVWWHIHPVTGWSGTDLNTRRQRVHETGLPEVMSLLSLVLTPRGIRACWDQSGPATRDNIFVDEIPVLVGEPDILDVIDGATEEAKALLAERKQPGSKDKSEKQVVQAKTPKATWRRQVLSEHPFGPMPYSDALEELAMDVYASPWEEMVMSELIRQRISPMEEADGFLCRKDTQMTTDLDTCASCPFSDQCFAINTGDWNDMHRRLLEEIYG